jgi:hypothetical protein
LNGKTEIYKKFQYYLLRELKQEMPNDVDEYLRVRKISGLNNNGNDISAGFNVDQNADGTTQTPPTPRQ